MMIEIDADTIDSIMQQELVSMYSWLTDDLKNNKSLHPEDREIYKVVSEAMKVLGNWYFIAGEFDKAVKKFRKKK